MTAGAGEGLEPVPVVEVFEVEKGFGRQKALDGLSLAVFAGETYGLIGPNGSGKTTLMRILMGLLRADRGWVRVLGQAVPSSGVARQVGYMTQAGALYRDLTVRQNVAFFGNLYGLAGRRLKRRISEVVELVGLADRADSPVETLSGGMRQRASLAAALIHRPRLLILDEPTVGVDPELRRTFWEYFARLNLEGVTLLVSTHYLDEANRCHRLGFLREGQLIAQGTPRDIRERSGKEDLEEAFLHFAGSTSRGARSTGPGGERA